MTTPLSLRAVIAQLKVENTSLDEPCISVLLQERHLPWAVNILIGAGTWLATLLFLGSILLALTLENPVSVIVSSNILIVGAVLLNNLFKESLVINQATLAFCLTGQILLVIALSEMNIQTVWIALAVLVLAIILFAIYQHQIHRFFAVLIVVGAALSLLYELDLEQWLFLLILATAGGAVWCWLKEALCLTHIPTLQRPLGYGLVVALLGLVSPSLPLFEELFYTNWIVTSFGLTGLLLFVIYHNLRLNYITVTALPSILIFTSTLLIAGLLYQAPGIIAAMIVILLGFQRGNRFLMGLAFIFFVLFYIAFYYYLNITLLMKSITLISAGIVLLSLRLGLKRGFFILQL